MTIETRETDLLDGRGAYRYRPPLSLIPVPLAKPDSDILLDLQPMIHEIYQRFRYARSIDYTKPLTPPLDPAETGWLKQQLQAGHSER